MDYKKKYKEALEKIRDGLQPLQDGSKISGVTRAFLEEIFPELKESEDELIWLTNYIEEEAYNLSMDIRDNEDRVKLQKLQKALAWIKTHKYTEEDLNKAYKCADKVQYANGYNDAKEEIEQKYILNDELTDIEKAVKHIIEEAIEEGDAHNFKSDADMLIRLMQKSLIKPKFNVGDWIACDGETLKITQFEDMYDCYELTSTTGYIFNFISSKYVESKFHLWTIADAKDGDVLVADDWTVIFKKSFGDNSMLTYLQYDSINNMIESGCHLHYTDVYPATMKQRDFLFKKMK